MSQGYKGFLKRTLKGCGRGIEVGNCHSLLTWHVAKLSPDWGHPFQTCSVSHHKQIRNLLLGTELIYRDSRHRQKTSDQRWILSSKEISPLLSKWFLLRSGKLYLSWKSFFLGRGATSQKWSLLLDWLHRKKWKEKLSLKVFFICISEIFQPQNLNCSYH